MRDLAPTSVRFIPVQETCNSTVALACQQGAVGLLRQFVNVMRTPQAL